MIRTLARNWWLLAVCGLLDAAISVLHLLMQNPDGSATLRRFAITSTVVLLGRLSVAAGICTLATALWHSRKAQSWPLLVNGLAMTAFGLIAIFASRGRLHYLPVALLFVVMASSIGVLALAMARSLRGHLTDEWFLALAGVLSIAFALVFLFSGLGWLRFEQPTAYWLFMSSWFGFCAVALLALGLRLHRLRLPLAAA